MFPRTCNLVRRSIPSVRKFSSSSQSSPFAGLKAVLPQAHIDFNGVEGWISQSNNHQIVFMEISKEGEVSPHSHGMQWGVVISGLMRLTISGQEKLYNPGDSYYIPANVVHSASFLKPTCIIDFFQDAHSLFDS